MLNANEIVHWLEDERERVKECLADEAGVGCHNNHLATAYMAELDLIDRLLTDIAAPADSTQHDYKV